MLRVQRTLGYYCKNIDTKPLHDDSDPSGAENIITRYYTTVTSMSIYYHLVHWSPKLKSIVVHRTIEARYITAETATRTFYVSDCCDG